MRTADTLTALDELDQDERAAFLHLSEYDLTSGEMLDMINDSFRPRFRELVLPRANALIATDLCQSL